MSTPESPAVVTVDALLALPEVQAGAPELVCGAAALDSPVRWVHIADSERVAPLLEGGELVLSTGLSFRGSAAATARFLDDLEGAGAAGAVVELVDAGGSPDRPALAALREAAAGRGLPVVALTRTVRFVRITQVAHRMLVGEQLARVERARRVHEVFTQLSLESADERHIVAEAGRMLGAPVVLEDVAHRVLAFHVDGTDARDLLDDWAERARRVGYQEATGRREGPGDWLQTPVGVRGRRWGRLVVPSPLDDDADAAQVLERAGQALTIARMASRDERDLLQQAQAGLLHELRPPRTLTEPEALARAAAVGLEPAPFYVPAVVRLDRLEGEDPTGLQLRERAALDGLASVARQARRSVLAAGLHSGSLGVLVGVPAVQLADGVLGRLFGQLAETAGRDPEAGGDRGRGGEHGPVGQGRGVGRGTGEIGPDGHRRDGAGRGAPAPWTVGVGPARPSLLEAAAGLEEATQVADIAATLAVRRRRFHRFADLRVRGLLSSLRADPRVRAFAQSELGPLLEAGDEAGLELLEAFLRHSGNKASLARASHLSRPALYARLARLEERLGVSLEDAESRTALHVALLWHRLEAGAGAGRNESP